MRDLKTDMETLRAVLAHAQNRDFQSAGDLAAKTLASGFEHPMLLNVLATRYEEQGRFEDSLQLLERAVAIAPGDVGARNALALCLQRLDRPADSLVHIEELLKRQPDLGFAHANKGNALIALGSLARAKESHLRALELDPGNLAATAALAAIATQRGAHDEARSWAEQALKTAPGCRMQCLSLAAAELASGATAKAESLLHRLIVDSRAGQLTGRGPPGCSVTCSMRRAATPKHSMPIRPATRRCVRFISASRPVPACSRTHARLPRRWPRPVSRIGCNGRTGTHRLLQW